MITLTKTAVLLQVFVLLFVPTTLGEDSDNGIQDLAGIPTPGSIEDAIQEALKPLANLSLAALPTITVDGVSLSLVDLELKGLNIINVSGLWPGTTNTPARLTLNMPRATLTVGTYIAGGNLLNLPFNGEGPLSVTLHDLKISASFEWDTFNVIGSNFCAKYNSTNIDLDLRRMEVIFENLNPGTDQGQLVNIMLSSFGPDIFDYLETFLDNEFYEAIDLAIVGAVNSQDTCKTPPSEDTFPVDLTNINIEVFVQQILDQLTHFKEQVFLHF